MDKNYWNNYYAENNQSQEPTSFAKSIIEKLPDKSKLMELGCGNGRDSYYFAENGHLVTACDQSEVIINSVSKNDSNNPNFLVKDIKNLSKSFNESFDVVYARFVLHALDESESRRALEWTFQHLNKGGLFFSESRSIKDSIFGDGTKAGERVFKTDHHRRFLNKNELVKDLTNIGFSIEDVIEEKDLAIYKDSDPVVIRIIARKA